MKTMRKIWTFPLICSLLLHALGCTLPPQPLTYVPVSDIEPVGTGDSVARRFQTDAANSPTGLESAIKLSREYAKLADEAAELRKAKQQMAAENQQLKKQVASLETELNQARKELSEANTIMREMVVELNNWKSNVIGFREEIRGAEKAQLEALLKILKVLGGEFKEQTTQNERNQDEAGTSAVSAGESVQAPPQQQVDDAGRKSG